jgi:flagellar protein FliL
MAQPQPQPEPEADGEQKAPSKLAGKKRLILIGVLLIGVIGLSVGATLFALKFFAPPAEEKTSETPEEAVPELPKQAIYHPLKPAINVNFSVRGRQRFLQAELTLMTRDESVIPAIELHQSMIRNALILLIGGQPFEELQTAEGKELLRQQCLQEIQRLLQQEINKPGIEQVLFTSFVMQ